MTYKTTTIALRAPRVAVLFPAHGNWRGWARLALRSVSRHWGGGGYVLIPVTEAGDINPRIEKAAQAYDPDYIAYLTADAATWYRLSPEHVRLQAREELGEAEFVQSLVGAPVDDAASLSAATRLFERCSPLNYAFDRIHHPIHRLPADESTVPAPFLTVPLPGFERPFAALASSPSWDDDVSLFALARTGAAPQENQDRPSPEPRSLLKWVINQDPASAPEELLWFSEMELSVRARDTKNWFTLASPNLANIASGFAEDPGAVVVGDGANDFALALAYDRLLGYGLWLTPTMITQVFSGDYPLRYTLEHTLNSLFHAQPIPLTSTTLHQDEIEKLQQTISATTSTTTINGQPVESQSYDPLVYRTPKLRGGLRTLALLDHLGETFAVPAKEDDDGTIHLQTPLAPLIPAGLPEQMPLDGNGAPQWIVDVSVESQSTPSGRGLDSKWMLDQPEKGTATMLRSSRAGVSFLATTHGFVASGTVLASRLASPRIRQLGVFPWTQAMAEASGAEASYSRPGRFSALVAKRLGGRDRLIQIGSGPLLPFLKEYIPSERSQTTSQAFPQHDGVELEGKNRYLTFRALVRSAPSLPIDESRTAIDELLAARLMRQGLVLDCQECAGVSFTSIDDLRQDFECKLCGATNELALARWKSGSAEPEWYYDLHRAFRSIVAENGDVVLLAANHLRSKARTYSDTSEIEFKSSDRAELNFEIDLIANVDGEVVVLEAKSNGSLGRGASRGPLIRKRFVAAQMLHADRVVFATTAASWSDRDVAAAESIANHEFPQIPLEFVSQLSPAKSASD